MEVNPNLTDKAMRDYQLVLAAINQGDISIPYPLTLPGTVSEPVETILSNLGNQPVDVLVNGTDLVGNEYSLDKSFQKWDFDPDFDYETEGYSLVETAILSEGPQQGCVPVTLDVHGDDSEDQDISIHWKMFIPKYQKADDYTGAVSFNYTSAGSCEEKLSEL